MVGEVKPVLFHSSFPHFTLSVFSYKAFLSLAVEIILIEMENTAD